VLLVSSAQNDGIQLLGGAVLEGAELSFDLLEDGLDGESFGPVEVHGLGSVGASDVSASVLVDLRSDIFSRVGSSDDHDSGVGELTSISEVMRVEDSSLEFFDSGEVGNVRDMEVTSACEHPVESLGSLFTGSDRAFGGVLSDGD
jgi:hypothetical protein